MNETVWGPKEVGGYQLLELVSSSPTGAVWHGRDPALGRDVAVKQVARNAFASVERLRAEAQLLARLPHPNIVTVIDLVETPDQLWLIEEWIAGAILPEVVAHAGRLSAPQAVGTVRGALLGLAHAHANRIVHGDVAPANLLLDLHGTTRLIDFGLAGPAGAPGVTGTPGYLSPEAVRGQPLVPASDVYSAAAVLALLLRGRPLYEGASPQTVLAAQFAPQQPDLRGIPGPVAAVLAGALSPQPGERPADAGRMLGLLDEAAERSFGSGWWGAAGMAGAVSAAVTATVAGGAPTVLAGAPAMSAPVPSAPVAVPAPPSPAAPLRPNSVRAASKSRAARGLLHSPRALIGIGIGAVALTAAVIIATQLANSPATPVAKAARLPTVSRTTNGVQPAAFDLHRVNWDGVQLPGRLCFRSSDITLHNGKAVLPAPGATSPPGSPPNGYELIRSGSVQYGQLRGGPQVAVLNLMCAGTGTYSGTGTFWPSIAVFDAVGGKPHLLGAFRTAELGIVPATTSSLVALKPGVRDGVLTVSGDYWHGADAHCCPSGRATTTVAYLGGRLVPTKRFTIGTPVSTSPAQSPTPSPTAAPAGTGHTISVIGHSGRKYLATVVAQDTVKDCAANSYGAKMIAFFRAHPCTDGAGRRLVTIPFHGRTLALSIITVSMPASRPGDPYQLTGQLARLENASGTGGLDDLLRSGNRPAGWPSRIPPHEAFVLDGEDLNLTIFDAWYLSGSTTDQDPQLVALAHDVYLTNLTLGPF